MNDCDHQGKKIYAKRTMPNGAIQYCVQCLSCLDVVKMPEHGNRPYITHLEIPEGRAVHTFIAAGQAQ